MFDFQLSQINVLVFILNIVNLNPSQLKLNLFQLSLCSDKLVPIIVFYYSFDVFSFKFKYLIFNVLFLSRFSLSC